MNKIKELKEKLAQIEPVYSQTKKDWESSSKRLKAEGASALEAYREAHTAFEKAAVERAQLMAELDHIEYGH